MDHSSPLSSLGSSVEEDMNVYLTQLDITSPPAPLDVEPIQMVVSDEVEDETNNTTTSPCLMIIPYVAHNHVNHPMVVEQVNTKSPSHDATPQLVNTNSSSHAASPQMVDANVGLSTGPTKRGRGRPRGSQNINNAPKKPRGENSNNGQIVKSSPNFDAMMTEEERENGNKDLVDSVLMRFDAVRRKLCQLNIKGDSQLTSATSCKNLNVRTNTKKRVGPVPGIREGDVFYYFGEMGLVGLHTQLVAGIDYFTAKDDAPEGCVATSVVTSGHYNDKVEDLDTLVYTGQSSKDDDGKPCDQKLTKGNLAMHISKERRNDVRLIRGEEDPCNEKKKIYVYDGLFTVTDCWKETAKSGLNEFKFRMVRKPGQPSGYAMWKSIENLRNTPMTRARKGYMHQDLSLGRENVPVSVVNEVDDERLEVFDYTNAQHYSSTTIRLHDDGQAHGCHCHNCQNQKSCSPSYPNCKCIQKNGGELPYIGSILVCRKPIVYECGTSCLCSFECDNRLLHRGVKIRLEVFKTANRGWGLRSLDPIRVGTFICEFAGKNKNMKDIAEDDNYVFDSTRTFNLSKWNYEPELIGEAAWTLVPEVFNLPSPILISARNLGNVGRFINHNCSPNVFWQPVEYEANLETYVRIGFFAMKHIRPMTELTYDYGASEDDVINEDEKVLKGKKNCLCDSEKCRGSFD